jgi:hypothetical protein
MTNSGRPQQAEVADIEVSVISMAAVEARHSGCRR